MKKLVSLLIIMLLLVGCTSKEKENKKEEKEPVSQTGIKYDAKKVGNYEVTMTIFHSNSCGHCHDLKLWLNNEVSKYPYLKVEMYEASENYDLYTKVKNKLNLQEGVPLIIIGNDHVLGYAASLQPEITDYIKKNSTYETCNVVDAIKNNKDVDACMRKNEFIVEAINK